MSCKLAPAEKLITNKKGEIMDIRTEYGIICQREDEKELVKRINKFLKDEYGYRKIYKKIDDSISAFNYVYGYFQFIEEKPCWYFDLFPNEDLDGKLKFDNKDTQWILWVNKQFVDNNTEEENEEVNVFFEKLIEAIGYETIVLHKYKDENEERIGNDFLDFCENSQNTQSKEMREEMSELLDGLSEQGNEEMENENYSKAIEYFNQAFEILPEPKEDWEASAWLYTSIGDANFCMEKYETALDNFQQAYKIYVPESLNPFVLLRIGQCYFHLQDKKNAIEFLLRAYMLDGEEIFEGAENYFDFLKSNVKL